MKFGKEYDATLAAPGIPPEWRQKAIEYRKVREQPMRVARLLLKTQHLQLKKVINRIAHELEELGLTADVLRDLLSQPTVTFAPPTATAAAESSDDEKESNVHVEVTASEDEGEAETESELEEISDKARGKRKVTRRRPRAHASYVLGGESPSLPGRRRELTAYARHV